MNEWRTQAACKGMDPAMFVVERGESTAPAKAVCATCPVTDQCLDWALTTGEKFGVLGGTSERERRQLRAQRNREAGQPRTAQTLRPIKHGTTAGYAAERRRGLTPCDECRAANATAVHAYKTKTRTASNLSPAARLAEIIRLRNEGVTVARIAIRLDCSPGLIHKEITVHGLQRRKVA